ncbi:hypothetical protein GJ688_14010 [Heliobacillus mobilis]|uniref:Phage protein, HK97 gp10 family n=1 Tax=Heliobacterium mobile TaxID=28064 RepID=A0A6I3SPA8_HELMO|nr:hypothetical protein [Heliobacterium mobile]MTV50087.1 hypothetical protein [Heliobacterium mobile]
MANITVDAKEVLHKLAKAEHESSKALVQAVNDCADDLLRVSSEIAPHDKGILEKSYAREVNTNRDQVTVNVQYAVREGNLNYAVQMHEGEYRLGPGSRAKPGTEGMSGTHYNVGNKFLTRPLEGEADTYRKHIRQVLRQVIQKDGQ